MDMNHRSLQKLKAPAIKMCGMQSMDDCDAAVGAGATLLGFNFWSQSKRYVGPTLAVLLAEAVPAPVIRVGLFVNATAEEVRQIVNAVPLDILQFHGDESPEFCRSFDMPFMKAFRLRDEAVLRCIPDYLDDRNHPFLVDAYVPGEVGGTGKLASWPLAIQAQALSSRMLLAGGLHAKNVNEAVQAVNPWGVDVASGIEDNTGRKDRIAMDAFVTAAHRGHMETVSP